MDMSEEKLHLLNNVEIAEKKDVSYGEFTLLDRYNLLNIKEF